MLKGEKIILDSPREEHLEQMLRWRNNPEYIQYYREYRVLNNVQQHMWWKNKILNDQSWQYFVVKPVEEPDKIIGVTGLTYIHPIYKTAEFAITIGDPEYRGSGYGSNALRTVIKYGFEQLNLNRIFGEVYNNNEAVGVYRHIGFKDEGTLRQTVFKNGKYCDSFMLGMLRSDYEEAKKRW
jgi:hypothetical protein